MRFSSARDLARMNAARIKLGVGVARGEGLRGRSNARATATNRAISKSTRAMKARSMRRNREYSFMTTEKRGMNEVLSDEIAI